MRYNNNFNHPVFTHCRDRVCWLPALIGGLASLTAAGISAASQSRQNKKNIERSKELSDYQWNKYDSPSAQLAAHHAAGINPFASGSLIDSPQSQIPDQLPPGTVLGQHLTSFIQPFAQLLAVNSQIKNIEAQTEQTEMATQGIELDNSLKKFDLGEFKPASLRLLEKQIEATEAGSQLSRAQVKVAAATILKTQAEKQGIDLKNRFQEMENEWKKIQGDKRMPENLVEWQELQNKRLRQQMAIDLPDETFSRFRTKAIKSMENLFDKIGEPGIFEHFFGQNLGEGGQAIVRAFTYMLLFKIMQGF